ncbi:palmitoyltransferase ZDHHC23-B-like isoform X5 [Acipenser ruthenus]|uniref:palmitoyltransferase ZDHHC23-B-like isoform X5 n=1 Tax=Acipenser ruthenus TaxID=7906 RepID=UPI00274034BE|nr:palmitoyltransferase ZDHHC23-B-like isoform X5 [Acipenser ruthenus]
MLSSEYGTVEVKTPCKSEGRWKQSGNKSPEIQTPVESQGIVRAMERAQMKRKALKLPETEESLCCCEYLDRNGEKNHIAACCCNCEDLDETCDRWCKCEPLNPDSLSRVAETLSDRFRLPWISGAQRVDITILPPLVLLPIFLHIAALHFLLALVILTALPVFVLWINSCVGQANHRAFLLTLLLFLLTSTYGISLTLGSVCPRQSVFTALFYCPGVYDQYSSALCFTCCWYGCIVTGALLHLFIVQLINVSYNVTEREACIALREKSGRSQLWGLIVDTGHFNHGFLLNWREFLSMNTSVSLQHHLEDVV